MLCHCHYHHSAVSGSLLLKAGAAGLDDAGWGRTRIVCSTMNSPGFVGGFCVCEDGAMPSNRRYSVEVRERAVRLYLDHRGEFSSDWAAMRSIGEKLGIAAETLRTWVRRAEIDQGQRPGVTTDERERLGVLERENRERGQTTDGLGLSERGQTPNGQRVRKQTPNGSVCPKGARPQSDICPYRASYPFAYVQMSDWGLVVVRGSLHHWFVRVSVVVL